MGLFRFTPLLLFLFLIESCNYRSEENTKYFCDKLDLNCKVEKNLLIFHTSKGIFEVQLFDKSNPVTVSNFILNVKNNLYSNQYFYKVINYPDNKIIHGGINANSFFEEINNQSSLLKKSIPLEINLKNEKIIYKNQILDPKNKKNLKNKFQKGSIAMVNMDKNNSSATEFFFLFNESPEFDGRYSIFGKVIKGIEILRNIDKNDFIKNIEIY